MLGKKVFDKLEQLERLNKNHAWICCALMNTFLRKGYGVNDITLAIESCIRQMKDYVTRKTSASFARSAVIDNSGPFMIVASVAGGASAYGVAQPAAVTAVSGATAATATSGLLAANIVAPMVALGVTIAVMTIVLGVKAYGRRQEARSLSMMAIIEQMETLLKATLELIEVEPVRCITITQPFFNEIVKEISKSSNGGVFKADFHISEEHEEFDELPYMLYTYRSAD
ncbi:hypothetical protein, partial [Enterobacter asburiae]|uniref:hypothetical protein n=1 Tax=Enterobacter asburiae TaxID=61645 RepID=UPI001FFFC348